jgi:uncharacterized protein (TIGR04255 family)
MIKKLSKAPLQEVIFEVRWSQDVDPDTQQPLGDKGYDFALGKFQTAIDDKFPFVQKTDGQFPIAYQFWKAENTWPVVQIGPGIMTFNDTDQNYVWEDNYYPVLKELLKALSQAYAKSKIINFLAYNLRYIDVVKVADYAFESWPVFIKQNLNFQFENLFDAKGKLKEFHFQQTFEQENGSGLNIVISNGKNLKNEDVLIWQIGMSQTKKVGLDALLDWVNASHEVTSKVFVDICKTQFYGSFNQ